MVRSSAKPSTHACRCGEGEVVGVVQYCRDPWSPGYYVEDAELHCPNNCLLDYDELREHVLHQAGVL